MIGRPTILWGMNGLPASKSKTSKRQQQKQTQERRINRLSMLLTLAAVLFFTGAVWALARHRPLDFFDGLVLILLFLFWQCFHVFDVLKNNVGKNKAFGWMLPIDLALLAIGAYGIYLSVDWLVDWISKIHTGFISVRYLGWLSGWLMVVPNGLLAFYYARRGNPEVAYTPQIADGHISIPLCIGGFALYHPIHAPPSFQTGRFILMAASAVHPATLALVGR